MNAFAALVADFAEKTGIEPDKPGADSFDVEADGVFVSAQYRADRDDCVIFTLPLGVPPRQTKVELRRGRKEVRRPAAPTGGQMVCCPVVPMNDDQMQLRCDYNRLAI